MKQYIKLYTLFLLILLTTFVNAQTGCDLLKKLGDDLAEAGSSLRPFFEDAANVGGKRIKAWEKLLSKQTWRTNVTYLNKVSRYTDNGLQLVDEGGEIVVKQANGVKVGKLDPNDVYNPGQMKVKGEVSGRHFDPDDAGGLIVKKSWANPTVVQSGIDDVTTHLARFTEPEAIANNNFMINRLNQIKNGQIQPTDFDKRFYTHELEEFARFQNKGIPNGTLDEAFYQNAHTASLESYSINETVLKIYPPDVPYPGYAGY